jgi:pimeloyl-ACP methyl ester carboxylesterase
MKNKKITIKNIFIIITVILLLLIFIIPLFISYPQGKFTEKELADNDSHFIEIEKVSVHYKMYGKGDTIFILLHGTLTTTYTWNEIIEPLSKIGRVITYDRPSFGLTSRPLKSEWKLTSPYGYEEQVEMLIKLMDRLNIRAAVLVGNSMGGAISMMTAERYPERIKALVLVDPVQNRHAIPNALRILANIPQVRRIGSLFIHNNIKKLGTFLYRLSYHDPSKIKEVYVQEYFKVFQVKNFEQGLIELLIAAKPFERLLNPEKIKVPTLVLTGDDDRVAGIKNIKTGTEDLIKLSKKIKGSQLAIIPDCGHTPQEECPELFVQAVLDFISGFSRN